LLTNSSARSRRSWPRGRGLVLAALALLVAGCADHIIPVLVPVSTARVKPGGPHHALVVLPNGAVASVYLQFVYAGGRIAISKIGIVNHSPDKITLLPEKSIVYVDDGNPLRPAGYRELDRDARRIDRQILEKLPPGSKGTWIAAEPKFVTQGALRGPTLVLAYRVRGHEGFVKVRYRALWDLSGP